MNLFMGFIQQLLSIGVTKRDIRFFVEDNEFMNRFSQTSITKFCKKFNINSGSVYHMLSGRRAIPLDILESFDIEPSNYKMIVSNSNIPIRIPIELTENLSYLTGLLRDGTVAIEKNNEYLCAYYSKDKEFINIVQNYLQNVFDINPKVEEFTDVYGIRIRSLTLYLFFKLLFEVPKHQKSWKTPKLIENADNEIQRWYITGFFDAEGGCPNFERIKHVSRKNLYVNFNQKNKKSLEFIKNILEKNGIKTGKIYWNNGIWVFKISSISIEQFSKYIKSQYPKKSQRLKKIGKIFSTNSMQPRVLEFTD